MSINRAEQTLESRLIDKIAYIERELNALKTRQLNGGDNMVIDLSGDATINFTITAGSRAGFVSTLTQLQGKALFPQLYFDVYIGTDNDADYAWPHGASLTTAQKEDVLVLWRLSDIYSDELGGVHVASFNLVNNTASDQTLYCHTRWAFPKVGL